ncbi:MAG: GDSL-type esterase/lipase family protein [Desulfoprunum sp.]|uniref:GDSL-type esterase/lipase family protein n=1 Tax=Desulfoprunum sp. TaxID=2020866 RepID=UPI003C77B85B
MFIRTSQAAIDSFLFLGDSLVADNNWQSRIPYCKVLNYGVPGATVDDLLAALPDLSIRVDSPAAILIMIGTNDALDGQFDFVDGLRRIVIQLSREFPTAEIIVTSLLPMRLSFPGMAKIARINEGIKTMTMQTGSCYLDVCTKFTQSDADLFQADGVHLTPKAYEIWTRTLLEHVAFLIENDDE